jgi:L-alanine-DL-glutamate epimerase-like enolase superfamily enzyme
MDIFEMSEQLAVAFYRHFGGMVRCMQVARMANVLGKQCIPHISATGLGYVYMMHFISAIPNSGPYDEFKEFNNDLPWHCSTSTLAATPTESSKSPPVQA